MKINDDLIGTVKNSTKWNNLERDTITANDVDTWIPVLNGEKMQHTTVASINSRGIDNAYSTSQEKSYSSNYSNTNFLSSTFNEVSITTNNTYINSTGYLYCYKNSRICMFNGNFRINTVPPKDAILCSGLPVPKNSRVTFIGITDTTAVRLYINDSGNLCTDSTNFTTGWVNCAIMYLLP